MRPLTIIEICLAAVLVLVGGIALHEYEQGQKALAVAQESQKARDEANKLAQQQIDALKGQIEQVKAANQQQVDNLVKTVAALKTPQQQVQWSQQQLADAIKGITISVNPKTGEAQATIPAAAIPDLPAVIEKCKACELNLDTKTKELTYTQQQQALMSQQLVAVTQERDTWKVAARGGTKWQRTVRALKYIGIGAGVGFIAGHKF